MIAGTANHSPAGYERGKYLVSKRHISAQAVIRLWAIPIIALALRCGPTPAIIGSYLILAGYALLGRRQAIVSLFCVFIFTNINHSLGRPIAAAAIMRWVILFAAAFSVFSRGKNPGTRVQGRWLLPTTGGIVLLILIHSLLFSPIVDVSILKAFSFGVAILTLLAAWAWEDQRERELTEIMLLSGMVFVTLASIPLLVLPMGFGRNNVGFQGVLFHPQTFGPFVAILAAYFIARWLTTKRLEASATAMLAVCVACIYLSRARIAAFAFAGGVGLAAASYPLQAMISRMADQSRPLVRRVLLIAAAGILAAAIAGPTVFEKATEFVQKGSQNAETITDVAFSSRGFLIDRMTANISAHSLVGIGFGVPSDPEDYDQVARDPIFGLAIAAPVEKGVMPIAITEELGIPFATIIFLWMAALGCRAAQGGIAPLSVFLTAMLTNVAEATFFSPGGMGLLMLIVITWAVTAKSAPQSAGVNDWAKPLRCGHTHSSLNRLPPSQPAHL